MILSGISKLLPMISSIAPTIANAIIPGGGLVVTMLENLFGVEGVDALSTAISQDPDAAVKLKDLELTHKTDLVALANADNANARATDIQVRQSTVSDWVPHVLAMIIISIYIFLMMARLFSPSLIDHESYDQISSSVGSLVGIVFGYYFVNNFKSRM